MKIGVLGASGFIGSYVLENLAQSGLEYIGTFFRHPEPGLLQLDCTDHLALERYVIQECLDCIIVLASQPNVEWCEKHPGESYKFNVLPLLHLSEIITANSNFQQPKLIFVSSDYVFNGSNGPYVEESLPNPLNIYGRHKLAAEKIVLALQGTVARTTVVYGWEKNRKNFVERLTKEVQKQRSVPVPIDQIGSPTYVEDVAKGIVELATRQLTGIYHLAGPDLVSRYEFALLAARIMQFDSKYITPVTTAELGQIAPRPLQAGMISEKFTTTAGWRFQGIQAGLTKMEQQLCRIER